MRKLLVITAVLISAVVMNGYSFLRLKSDVIAAALEDDQIGPREFQTVPFNDRHAHVASEKAIYAMPSDPDAAAAALDHALDVDPLNSLYWLTKAELAIRGGDFAQVEESVTVADELWPNSAPMQWRVASIYSQLGIVDKSFESLRAYLSARPNELARVLSVAQHLVDDQSTLYDHLRVDELDSDDDGNDDFVYGRRMLYAAQTQNKHSLVDRVWSLAPADFKSDEKFLHRQLTYLLKNQRNDKAIQTWREAYPLKSQDDFVWNGDFEDELLDIGFGWRTKNDETIKIDVERQVAFTGSKSLAVEYLGKENLTFKHPHQLIPVEPNSNLKLTGIWRGDGLTTRPGVFIELKEVFVEDGAKKLSESKRGDWTWEKFEMNLRTGPQTKFVLLTVVRFKSENFDNLIEGKLWLDNVQLVATPTTPSEGALSYY